MVEVSLVNNLIVTLVRIDQIDSMIILSLYSSSFSADLSIIYTIPLSHREIK